MVRSKVKIAKVGNSLGAILPREMLWRLNVDRGDKLYIVQTPTGCYLTPYDPEFGGKMRVAKSQARKVSRTHRRNA